MVTTPAVRPDGLRTLTLLGKYVLLALPVSAVRYGGGLREGTARRFTDARRCICAVQHRSKLIHSTVLSPAPTTRLGVRAGRVRFGAPTQPQGPRYEAARWLGSGSGYETG